MKGKADPIMTASVVIIDDDDSVRRALTSLLRSVGYDVCRAARIPRERTVALSKLPGPRRPDAHGERIRSAGVRHWSRRRSPATPRLFAALRKGAAAAKGAAFGLAAAELLRLHRSTVAQLGNVP